MIWSYRRYFTLLFCLLLASAYQSKAQEHRFIENKGQWHNRVEFKAELGGGDLYFEKDRLHYQFYSYPDHHEGKSKGFGLSHREEKLIKEHRFEARFINANPAVEMKKSGESPYYYNYFLGNDQESWATEVRTLKKISYKNLYPGIDLKFYEVNGSLKYDFIIESTANYQDIQFQYEGIDKIRIEDGRLIIDHSLGELIETKPYAYQMIDGEKQEVAFEYELSKKKVISFKSKGEFNPNYPIVIDPVLVFSTYSGSISDNFGLTATYDSLGNGYMGGIVFGNRYDTTLGAFQTTFAGGTIDIAISKLNPQGTTLLFSTYLGGNLNETSNSLVIDDSLNLFVFGTTASTNFPTSTNAYDRTKANSSQIGTEITDFSGGSDIFVTKFSPDGKRIKGSTYYGGLFADGINFADSQYGRLRYNYGDSHRGEVIVDSAGYCYIGTCTRSPNLGGAVNTHTGITDGLIVKFSPNLDSVIFSRYLGGSGYDAVYSLKILNNGNILAGGGTTSFNTFPTTAGAYRTSSFGGRSDGFLSILSTSGQSLLKSSFIGTDSTDQIYFVEFDRFNNVYGYGITTSQTFPLKNTSVANVGAGQFFIKLDPNLDSLEMSTTFGVVTPTTNVNISPTAFLVDRCFNIYASGWGGSLPGINDLEKVVTAQMPLTPDAFQSTTNGNDLYLYVINGSADSVVYGSFFGGSQSRDHVDGGTSRFDKDGVIYQSVCASCGNPTNDFPTSAGAHSRVDRSIVAGNRSNCNNALFKYDFQILPIANFSSDSTEFCIGANDTVAITITDRSVRADKIFWDFYGTRVQSNFDDTTIFITQAGQYIISQVVEDTVCATGDITTLVINARPDNLSLDLNQDTLICYADSLVLQSNAVNTNQLTWATDPNFFNVLQRGPQLSFNAQLINGLNTYYVKAENTATNACELVDSITINYYPTVFDSQVSRDTICQGEEINFNASAVNIDKFIWDFGNGTIDSVNFNRNITYNSSGNYNIKFIIQSDSCPISDTTSYSLNVQANTLVLSSIPDSIYCGTDTVRLSISANRNDVRYVWSSNNRLTDTLNGVLSNNDLTFFSNTNRRLYFSISDLYCSEIDSTNIRYIEYDVDLADVIDSVCAPADIQLNSSQIGVDNFSFDFGNGSGNTNNTNPTTNYSDSGTYIIRLVTNNTTCLRSDTLYDTLRVEPEVVLLPINDTIICIGDTIQLDINTTVAAEAYQWSLNANFLGSINSNNRSDVNISPSTATTYFYKAENSICEADSSVLVDVEILDVFLDDFTSICIDDTISIDADELSNLNPAYLWEPRDSIIGSNTNEIIQVAPKQDIFYFLESTSALGCIDLDTIEVEVNVPAFTTVDIFLSADTIFEGQSIQLSTNRNGSNLSYFWESNQGVSDANSPNPFSTPSVSGEYKVTVFDNSTNCEVIAFKRIVVLEINCVEPEIFIPTAFTPNVDGTNDMLFVRGNIIKSIELQIFNRWGEKVFESTDLNMGWDGKHNGKELDPGVFAYHLKAICFDDQVFEKKGNITLIR